MGVALGLPALLAWAYPRYAARAEIFYVAEYALVYATLCAWFASSLAGTPVITRVARRVHPLTPDMQAYTVRLTRGWALYFALMAALSLLVFALLGLPAWAFFTVVLSPISLASFLIGEHLLRYGKLGVLHRALRDAVLARLRRRDPLAAAQDSETQAALVASRVAMTAAEVRATLDTRPPVNTTEFRHRIARLIDLRKRL